MTCSPRLAAQRVGERGGHDVGPEVLVLDVDEPARPAEGARVGAGDGALALRREGVRRLAWRGRCAAPAPGAGRPPAAGPTARAAARGAAACGRCGAPRPGRGCGGRAGCWSSHRSVKVSRTCATAGPRISAIASCHGGASPYLSSRGGACGSPACEASSRRPWHRSIPPTNATSSSGRSLRRTTSSFWWCEPPRRTRSSSSASPPHSLMRRPRWPFSSPLSWPGCERHMSARTSTPRATAALSSSATVGPSSVSRSSESPRQSVKKIRSPALRRADQLDEAREVGRRRARAARRGCPRSRGARSPGGTSRSPPQVASPRRSRHRAPLGRVRWSLPGPRPCSSMLLCAAVHAHR